MVWAKIDDGWWCHPKVLGISLAASGLWARALSWSCQQRRDTVPTGLVRMLAAGEDLDTLAGELEQAGLWHPIDGGWRIHDWVDYQERTLSEKRAEAGRKGGLATAKQRGSKPEANGDGPTAGRPHESADSDAVAGEIDADAPAEHTAASASKRPSKPQASGQAGIPSRPVPSRPDPSKVKPTTSPVGDGSDDPPAEVDVSEDARTLTRQFATAVQRNGHPVPGKGTKANQTWLVEMDRLLRLGPPGEGGHVPDAGEVRRVIDYATSDDFERANVASVPKLRKRFAQLRLKANGTRGGAPPSQRVSEFTETRRL